MAKPDESDQKVIGVPVLTPPFGGDGAGDGRLAVGGGNGPIRNPTPIVASPNGGASTETSKFERADQFNVKLGFSLTLSGLAGALAMATAVFVAPSIDFKLPPLAAFSAICALLVASGVRQLREHARWLHLQAGARGDGTAVGNRG